MRGIGATVINFINSLSDEAVSNNQFTLIASNDYDDPENFLELLDLSRLDYSLHYTNTQPLNVPPAPAGKITRIRGIGKQFTKLYSYFTGNTSLRGMPPVDIYIQFDQQQSMPRLKAKKVLVVYDIIPYVLEWQYLYSYHTARLHEHSRKGSLYMALQRWAYITKLRFSVRLADSVIAISEKTKNDIVQVAKVPARKIDVIHLGVTPPPTTESSTKPRLHHYIRSSWGYIRRPLDLDLSKTAYLLFVGGVDKRRRMTDLVGAFNHLRAQGIDLKLVLVGDIMQGPENIPITETRLALEHSSYANDILYMGFVNEQERHYLYTNALSFVYPSTYEGFGLPVLEAMSFGTPVICYDNAAVREVAGPLPLYTSSSLGIAAQVQALLEQPDKFGSRYQSKLIAHATKRTWADFTKKTLEHFNKIATS